MVFPPPKFPERETTSPPFKSLANFAALCFVSSTDFDNIFFHNVTHGPLIGCLNILE